MLKGLSKILLRIWGFRIEGSVPPDLKKCVYAVVPHTSNWDFPLGLLVRRALSLKINFAGKKSLFKPPFGWIFRSLGGYPVDRSKKTNLVESMAQLFMENEYFRLAIAPEGTRAKVDYLKTGFYYIAKLAKVPIILVKFDGANKKVIFRPPFYPTENSEADLAFIDQYFRGTIGLNPKNSFV